MTIDTARAGGLPLEPAPPRPRRRRSLPLRLARAVLLGNLVLLSVLATAAIGAHIWITSSEERRESAIAFASRYVLVPASLIEDHGFKPEALESTVRIIEKVVIDSAGWGPRSDGHLYWQARVLMVMPAVYKRLGRTEERIERAERAMRIFADLAQRQPDRSDYRRRLSVTTNMYADDLADMGRHDDSIAMRGKARAVAEQLLDREPGHWRWRWYVAWAELGTGQSLIAMGRRDHAVGHIESSRIIARDLCRERPADEMLCALARRVEAAL